jgi:ribosomal protein S26
VGRMKKDKLGCGRGGCVDCKQAICGSKVFCGWLKKFVDESRFDDGVEIVVCPRFEMEPLEYKVYRRT